MFTSRISPRRAAGGSGGTDAGAAGAGAGEALDPHAASELTAMHRTIARRARSESRVGVPCVSAMARVRSVRHRFVTNGDAQEGGRVQRTSESAPGAKRTRPLTHEGVPPQHTTRFL